MRRLILAAVALLLAVPGCFMVMRLPDPRVSLDVVHLRPGSEVLIFVDRRWSDVYGTDFRWERTVLLDTSTGTRREVDVPGITGSGRQFPMDRFGRKYRLGTYRGDEVLLQSGDLLRVDPGSARTGSFWPEEDRIQFFGVHPERGWVRITLTRSGREWDARETCVRTAPAGGWPLTALGPDRVAGWVPEDRDEAGTIVVVDFARGTAREVWHGSRMTPIDAEPALLSSYHRESPREAPESLVLVSGGAERCRVPVPRAEGHFPSRMTPLFGQGLLAWAWYGPDGVAITDLEGRVRHVFPAGFEVDPPSPNYSCMHTVSPASVCESCVSARRRPDGSTPARSLLSDTLPRRDNHRPEGPAPQRPCRCCVSPRPMRMRARLHE